MPKLRLRFEYIPEEECFRVLARRKTTGKYEVIGTCHAAAVSDIKTGKLELIQFNV